MVLRVCQEEGLGVIKGVTGTLADDLYKTVHCESNFNPRCVHPNIVNGKTVSTDYGICQINDYYHIGPGKDFPSVDYVLTNPEACVRWMAQMFKAGKADMWVCHLRGMFKFY